MTSSSSQVNSLFRYTRQDIDLICGLGLMSIITVSFHCKWENIIKQGKPDSFLQVFEEWFTFFGASSLGTIEKPSTPVYILEKVSIQ